MNKSDEQEKIIARHLYELDKKVYSATGSTLGRIFSEDSSFAIQKIIRDLHGNRKHFLKNEMTLINNMIGTIKDREKAAELEKEYIALQQDIASYNPEIDLPKSIDATNSLAAKRFSGNKNMIICISRQYGTGGHTIGYKLAQKLGIAYYDKEIINMAYEHLNLDKEDQIDFSEHYPTGLFSSLSRGPAKFLSNKPDMLYFCQSKMIRDMAKQESCIIMGRCGDAVLASHHIPRLSIFLTAPFEERVKFEMGVENSDYSTASTLVRKMDRSRRNYYYNYTGLEWGNAQNYDLCINTFFYGEEGTVNLIENMVDMAYNKLDERKPEDAINSGGERLFHHIIDPKTIFPSKR